MCLERTSGFFVAMCCEVVENQCGSWRDLKDQYLLHVGRKGKAVHGTFDHRRSDHGVNGQSCDQGLGSQTTKVRIHFQAFAAQVPAKEPSEVRFQFCFVDENNAFLHPRNGC